MTTICAISDTHGKHEFLDIPEADILIHAGDVSMAGKDWEIEEFLQWFSKLPHKHKIWIAGNHDFYMQELLKPNRKSELEQLLSEYKTTTYLCDSGTVVEGLKIYGSPWQPEFHDWAFNLPRNGALLESLWARIPDSTNILVTHGPAYSILDKVRQFKGDEGESVGCELLVKRLENLLPPIPNQNLRCHIFGRIHESYGVRDFSPVMKFTSINASICNERYNPVNDPIVITI